MKISATSSVSGKEHTMDLPVTQEQLDRFAAGAMVQDVFPHLTADQREFLISGVTPEEWAAIMPDEEDEP